MGSGWLKWGAIKPGKERNRRSGERKKNKDKK